jgi:hypothetical protein
VGQDESIPLLVRKISKLSTLVSFMLRQYFFRWLREAKGVAIDPGALVVASASSL